MSFNREIGNSHGFTIVEDSTYSATGVLTVDPASGIKRGTMFYIDKPHGEILGIFPADTNILEDAERGHGDAAKIIAKRFLEQYKIGSGNGLK